MHSSGVLASCHNMIGNKIPILVVSLNTEDFYSVRLATHSVTYTQRCYGRTIGGEPACGISDGAVRRPGRAEDTTLKSILGQEECGAVSC
jgi:hypothetical protein